MGQALLQRSGDVAGMPGRTNSDGSSIRSFSSSFSNSLTGARHQLATHGAGGVGCTGG